MKDYFYSLKTMLGAAPHRYTRDEYTPEALELHKTHKSNAKERVAAIHAELADKAPSYKWRKYRWPSIIIINLLFVISFHFDVQLVEGALTASRFVGFHMADLNSALQVMLAYKHILINLVIGTVTVFILWWLVGGRAFCAWACPYHLVSELAEMLHLKLVSKRLIKDHPMHRGARTVIYVVFVLLALITGYTVFETISPVGIMSRALIYGGSIGLVWVGF
ncbi:MAG TPA: 4Fe-4S binding protein, partial [Rhizobiales bacterium]|nr:4Fe-4S binding protein [Hyphomicrobiales bacterium]